MPNLFDANCLTDFNAYKVAVKKALSLAKQDEIPFLYSEKHEFTKPANKKAPLFIVERSRLDPKFIDAVKKSAGVPLAQGTCYYSDDQSELVLEVTKGKVVEANFHVEGVQKVVVRAAADDAAAAKAPKAGTAEPNTGKNNAIDVQGRQKKELEEQVAKMRAFVKDAATNKAEFEKKLKDATEKRLECNSKKSTATKELQALKKANPIDQAKVDAVQKDVDTLTKLANDLFNARTEAQNNVAEVQRLTTEYTETLDKFDKMDPVKEFAKRYELMQHGRGEAIANVREKLNKVYEETGRKLVILGRTADTFEGDESWAAKHPKESGRVLQEDDWSMAVNDAFINSGLDQKAEFAMISKFKDSVLAKIKELLHNPGTRTPAELKKELREFAKKEGDKALFTGGKYNEGFAVSMIELEQLIDDGYVMMQHDTGSGVTPVMVPSGKGQKIKEELKGAVAEREKKIEELKKKISEEFKAVLKTSQAKIKVSKDALKHVQAITAALDQNLCVDADKSLKALKAAVA
jgi:hypothetical protein